MFTRIAFAAALMSAVQAQLSGCSLQAAAWEKGCSADEIEETLKWVVEGTFTDSDTCTTWSTAAQTAWGCPDSLDVAAMKTATIAAMPTAEAMADWDWDTIYGTAEYADLQAYEDAVTLLYFGVEDWQGVVDALTLTVGAEGVEGTLEGVDVTTEAGKQAVRDFMTTNGEALEALAAAEAAAAAADGEEDGEGEGEEEDFSSALKMGLAAAVSVFAVLA
jgi:hypothetical protein